ncbi:class E sortase [Streptomyces phaeolivaceus]|uniref:Class E sortase n=1 Tax=Streptomyces phaeolivaceus TaxID=2653200 RepID=A0A5P8K820_9ACTN|nr:class E sortase [Streptomyces phaeolivaceus]QFQ98757.1 class E sortase [Streptomyces phaeolivaceus]
MTALRPERESAPYGGEAAYGGAESFEAEAFEPGAPFGDTAEPQQWAAQQAPQYSQGDWYGQQEPYGRQPFDAFGAYGPPPQAQYDGSYEAYAAPTAPTGLPAETAQEHPPIDEETVALRVEEARRLAAAAEPIPAPPAPGGRAARRKAARRHGRHGGSPGAHTGSGAAQGAQEALGVDGTASPRSRMEARRAARAQKPGAGVIASRLIGEVFITTGVVMLLFVTYQLWWSNIRAHQQAGREATSLQEEWKSGKRAPGAFEPGQGFAILHIPKLDVVVPIAEGISKSKVLDRGMVGHYDENSIKTAMPEDKTGNFGIAGHRNTHGEPFRYINRLKPGDPIVVETQDKYYVYDMASILPVTPPSNVSVLNAVPPGSGFTAPGRYITLTTCTPEFTSKYRMIVWGKMVEERSRSEGKPDALVR